MPEKPVSRLSVIRRNEYVPFTSTLPHLFLAGNLQLPTPHPFFQRADVEVILCTYRAGNIGVPHWHEAVDEIEMILEGRVSYTEFPAGLTHHFEDGDVVQITKGTCVKRHVPVAARTLALKLPSNSSRIVCENCIRECRYRIVS